MKKNTGVIDRIVRVLLAILILELDYENIISETLSNMLLILVCILMFTAITGFCPLYKLIGVSTCKYKNQS
jgi:hypothetical protein